MMVSWGFSVEILPVCSTLSPYFFGRIFDAIHFRASTRSFERSTNSLLSFCTPMVQQLLVGCGLTEFDGAPTVRPEKFREWLQLRVGSADTSVVYRRLRTLGLRMHSSRVVDWVTLERVNW